MRIGLQIHLYKQVGAPIDMGRVLGETAQAAENAGFYSLWVLDHFFQMEGAGAVDEPMLEAYTTLGYLAALTQQIKLGVMVTGVIYRYPAILVKMLTTLDVLSGGRCYLGIGAAWYEREARGLGIPFPSTGERFERLEETLQIAHRMLSGDRQPYQGKHYRLDEPINEPRIGRPPILIGGMGEQKTLRLVARYGDACNLDGGVSDEVLRHKLEVLRGHCMDIGRNFENIEKTVICHVSNPHDVESVIKRCHTLHLIGFQQVMFNMPTWSALDLWGREVIPAVATL
ncbi:MAG: LLM class F420-dependent oxidoreductase [Anaerolineae bacterium]|jgi:F420-dependent oxidoreductase-like protein|nr:LLM class F420-dependent oxidoreductase [Anaerolineae bacterium]